LSTTSVSEISWLALKLLNFSGHLVSHKLVFFIEQFNNKL
jgi:hypothetical protein